MKRKKILCPKCRKPAYYLTEHWLAGIEFGTDKNGLWDGKDGYLEPDYATHVTAHCKCGYNWKLRKVLQITDIEGINDESIFS